MNTVKCDKCKKPKREKYSSLNKNSKWIGLKVHGQGDWLDFDLCGKCAENVIKYIKRYAGIKKARE